MGNMSGNPLDNRFLFWETVIQTFKIFIYYVIIFFGKIHIFYLVRCSLKIVISTTLRMQNKKTEMFENINKWDFIRYFKELTTVSSSVSKFQFKSNNIRDPPLATRTTLILPFILVSSEDVIIA